MLFFAIPVVIGIGVWFLNIAMLDRGNFKQAAGFGLLCTVLGFLPSIVICLALTDWGYNDIRFSRPVDNGEVRVSVPESGDANYSFASNGKTKIIESYKGDVVLVPGVDKNVYRKACGKTASWVAPFNLASCRTEIYTK